MSIQTNILPDNPQIEVIKSGKTGLFTNYIYKAIPLAFDESMSYYETLLGLLHYLKNVILPTVNNNADAVAEIQTLYEELRTYVDDYFKGLDVQEEINNKLDEMVENGTIPEIIASYLNSKAVFGFDNVESMKNATNLIDGSYAETLGFYEKNDGGKALYKIRKITNDDIINEKFIIAINNDLIAELIIKDSILNIKQIGAYGDYTHDDYTTIQSALTYGLTNNMTIFVPSGKYLINSTLILDNGNELILDENAIITTNSDIDLIKMKPYAKIKGGELSTYHTNYSHNLVSIISSTQQNIYGGIYNCKLCAYNNFASGSNGIKTIYEDSTNLCFFEILNCSIRYFDTAINLSTSYSNAWCTTFNIGNVHMSYCDKYINMDMPREISGHHIYACSIQPVQKQSFSYILNMNNAKYNNIEIMCWDVQPSNTNVIRLSNSCNYNILNMMPFEYNDNRISNNGVDNSFVSARMINNTYITRKKFKTINMSNLDDTYAYPVVFRGIGNFSIDSQSSSGDGGLTLFAKVVPKAYGVREPYSCFEIGQYQWAKKLTKIETVNNSTYFVIYLQGGKNYTLIDYNDSQYMSFEIKTESWTNADLTVEPVLLSSVNKVKSGIYVNFEPTIIDSSSTPLIPTN